MPGFLDLDDLVGKVRSAGLPARLTTSGQRFPMPPTAQLTVYRLVQEALTNTLKHAEATTAHVRLSYRDGQILDIEITDNGTGSGDSLVAAGVSDLGSEPPGSGALRERRLLAATPGGGLSATSNGGAIASGSGAVPSNGGHGIAGMRERAAMFGGQVEAGPLPAGGWRVHTQLRVNGADPA
jgi:signal transduction histidine kinase